MSIQIINANKHGVNIVTIFGGEGLCQLCGKKEELRPYGPKGSMVCFDCMMKDEEEGKRQFYKLIGEESPGESALHNKHE